MNELSTKNRTLLAQLIKQVEEGIESGIQAGIALKRIRDERLWEEDYDSFEDFCVKVFNFKQAHGYRLIEWSDIKLSPMGEKIKNERQARELVKVSPERREEVIKEASKGGLTAAKIKDVAKKMEEPALYDKTGYKLTKTALIAWNRANELMELIRFVAKVKSVIKEGEESGDIMYRQLNHTGTMAALSNAENFIKATVPYAVCTSCQGHNSNTCVLCKGTGMISKFHFSTCATEEIKMIRDKTIASYAK